jgi:hypothetical protein
VFGGTIHTASKRSELCACHFIFSTRHSSSNILFPPFFISSLDPGSYEICAMDFDDLTNTELYLSHIMRDFMFSQRCCWWFRSAKMWLSFDEYFPTIRRVTVPSSLRPWRWKHHYHSKRRDTHQTTQFHIPEISNLFHINHYMFRQAVMRSSGGWWYTLIACILYDSVSQPPGRGINYTGPWEVLLEFVICHLSFVILKQFSWINVL